MESQQAFTLGSLEEGGGEIQDGDDEAWWDEVVSTVANMECASQVPMSYTQVSLYPFPLITCGDYWFKITAMLSVTQWECKLKVVCIISPTSRLLIY